MDCYSFIAVDFHHLLLAGLYRRTALNLLAFAIHTVCDIGDEIWRLARQKHGSRSQFFNSFASITSFLIFASWDDFFQTLAFTKPPPLPP